MSDYRKQKIDAEVKSKQGMYSKSTKNSNTNSNSNIPAAHSAQCSVTTPVSSSYVSTLSSASIARTVSTTNTVTSTMCVTVKSASGTEIPTKQVTPPRVPSKPHVSTRVSSIPPSNSTTNTQIPRTLIGIVPLTQSPSDIPVKNVQCNLAELGLDDEDDTFWHQSPEDLQPNSYYGNTPGYPGTVAGNVPDTPTSPQDCVSYEDLLEFALDDIPTSNSTSTALSSSHSQHSE